MIPIIELNKILMNWVEGVRQVAPCEIVFSAFKTPDCPDQPFPGLTPCVNSEYEWLFWIDQFFLVNFGADVDDDGTTSIFYTARLDCAPDELDWDLAQSVAEMGEEDMRELDKAWRCWKISAPTRELLERELRLLRWNLELDEPDKRLDPREFLVCSEDAHVLRKLSEIVQKLLESLPENAEEAEFAHGLLEMLKSVPDVSGKSDYTDDRSGKKYYLWNPALRLEGIIGHEDSGFSCEANSSGLILGWDDYRSTGWSLTRGGQGGNFDDELNIVENLNELLLIIGTKEI